MHKSKAAPSLEVPSCTVTSLARSHLTVQLKNLARPSCITRYFLAADREKYRKKHAAVFTFTSLKNPYFPKAPHAFCLRVPFFCSSWRELGPVTFPFRVPSLTCCTKHPQPPHIILHVVPLHSSLRITRIICCCSGLWSSPSITLTDAD